MPQIYNLGGLTVHKLNRLHIDRFKDLSGVYPIMEVAYTSATVSLPQYSRKTPYSIHWRNIDEIICRDGTVILANNIREAG